MDIQEYKEQIFRAAEIAVKELIKVMEDPIITGDDDKDLSADKLKNAAATKKLAVFDAFEIMARIEEEKKLIAAAEGGEIDKKEVTEKKVPSFAEDFARKNGNKK